MYTDKMLPKQKRQDIFQIWNPLKLSNIWYWKNTVLIFFGTPRQKRLSLCLES